MSTIQQARELAELIVKKRDTEKEVKALNKKIAEATGPLLEAFAIEGIQRLPLLLEDGSTMTLSPKTIDRCGCAEGISKEAVAQALVAADLGDLVKQDFNFNSLSSLLREQRADGSDLPIQVLSLLNVRTDATINATRS